MASSGTLRTRRRSDYGFHLEYRTRWLDNDMYHHMNNSIYLQLFDSIINAYLIQHCGRDPASSEQIGIIVHSECNFFGSVAYPTVLELGLRVSKLGKTSVAYEVGVFEHGIDAVKAVGGYTHVFVDRQSSRPLNTGMTDQIRSGLSKLMASSSSKL